MNLKTLLPFVVAIFCLGANPLMGQAFIDFRSRDVKVVFTQVEIDGFTVNLATATIRRTTPDGTITVKRETYAVVPDGGGGFERRVFQETSVATPVAGSPGVFDVEISTDAFTTPVDSGDTPLGGTTTTNTIVLREDVNEEDLALPPSTEFFPIDEDLDDPVVVSPL
jgi:hypothetical protein